MYEREIEFAQYRLDVLSMHGVVARNWKRIVIDVMK